jgi:hypothetical protein
MCSFSAQTRNAHKTVVVKTVGRLQKRWMDNMKLHLEETVSEGVNWFQVGSYCSQQYLLLVVFSTMNFKVSYLQI